MISFVPQGQSDFSLVGQCDGAVWKPLQKDCSEMLVLEFVSMPLVKAVVLPNQKCLFLSKYDNPKYIPNLLEIITLESITTFEHNYSIAPLTESFELIWIEKSHYTKDLWQLHLYHIIYNGKQKYIKDLDSRQLHLWNADKNLEKQFEQAMRIDRRAKPQTWQRNFHEKQVTAIDCFALSTTTTHTAIFCKAHDNEQWQAKHLLEREGLMQS
ncbi:MAG: hypothetical protein JJT94_03880 [Bernardetiaceae bacterium]|nr:hypothetical protein [Bernardetiaceae bacterium]